MIFSFKIAYATFINDLFIWSSLSVILAPETKPVLLSANFSVRFTEVFMGWDIYFISGICKNMPPLVWKIGRYSKCLTWSNALNIYLNHTGWHSIYGYSRNSCICSMLTDVANYSGWEWSRNISSKNFVIIMTHLVHFWPVFTAFPINSTCIFWFSLLAASSLSGLDMSGLLSCRNSLCSQVSTIFSLKQGGDKCT